MHPDENYLKVILPVIDILPDEHPGMIVPDLSDKEIVAFEKYEVLFETVPADCDAEMVEEVASKLRGGA